jgi:hypothetical protein
VRFARAPSVGSWGGRLRKPGTRGDTHEIEGFDAGQAVNEVGGGQQLNTSLLWTA